MGFLNKIFPPLALLVLATGPAWASPPVMEVDGQPFFPHGWYTSWGASSVEASRQYLSSMKAQGMNMALICYGVWTADYLMTNQLEGAALNDMEIMVEVNRYAVQELPGYPLTLIDDQVDLCKDYPAFMGWYLIDEPELQGVTPAMAQARYNQIKTRDPSHPISVVHYAFDNNYPSLNYLSSEPPPYCDLLMTDTYVRYYGWDEFASPLYHPTKVAKVHSSLAQTYNKQAYISVVQTHEWGTDLGIPTYAEHRYLVYGPIINGARGILYWMHNAYTTEDHKNNVVGPIGREIESLIPAIISDSQAVTATSTRDADTWGTGIGDITSLLGEDSTGGYLMVSNNTPWTFPVTFTLTGVPLARALGPNATSVPVTFESRTVTAQPTLNPTVWTLTDTFTPYDVNVYRLYTFDAVASVDLGLPDVSDNLVHLQQADGGTAISHNTNGVNCRYNEDPSGTPADEHFYFAVNDQFAFEGNNADVFVALRYYDSGTGSLELQYDAVDTPYKSGGSVALTDTATWKEHTFHITDAYFGNRQNGGSDFRVFGGSGNVFYLDRVRVFPNAYVTSDKPNGDYRSGEEIDVRVKFREPVFVTGSPQLEMETGVVDRMAQYVSGSGADTLVFSFTVQAGDESDDLDYTSASALMMNGGAVKYAGGADADTTLPAPGAGGSLSYSKNLAIDMAAPVVTLISEIKSEPDGTVVSLAGKVLYQKESDFAYIEEPDRTSGIRLEGAIPANHDQLVELSGSMQTTTWGERYIAVSDMRVMGAGQIAPVGVTNAGLAETMLDGVYVTTWGTVLERSIFEGFFFITDGAHWESYVKVTVEGMPDVNEGDFVVVTGAAGVEDWRVIHPREIIK